MDKEESHEDVVHKPDLLFSHIASLQKIWPNLKILQLLQGLNPELNQERVRQKFGKNINGIGLYFVCFNRRPDSDESSSDNEEYLAPKEDSIFTDAEARGTVKVVRFWMGLSDENKPMHVVYPLGIYKIDDNHVQKEMFTKTKKGERINPFLRRFFSKDGIFQKHFDINLSLNLLLVSPDAELNGAFEYINSHFQFPSEENDQKINWQLIQEEQNCRAKIMLCLNQGRQRNNPTETKPIANNSSATFEDMQTKAATEEELNNALEIQAKLNNKNDQLMSTNNKLKSLQEELNETHKKHEEETNKLHAEKKRIIAEMSDLEKNPNFRTKTKVQQLRWRLEDIKSLVLTFRNIVLTKENDTRSCPVCGEFPRQIFSCLECEDWICDKCRETVLSCPNCKQDFLVRPPRRNKGIEQALGI